jgi:sugar (pentulose or hexulose) kinase
VVLGVCLSEADVLAVAEAHIGVRVASVHVAGRGAAKAPWRQARLNVLGRALHLLDEADASALGAAMLGAAAANGGNFDVMRSLRARSELLEPGPGAVDAASAQLARYRSLASASIPVEHRLVAPNGATPQ